MRTALAGAALAIASLVGAPALAQSVGGGGEGAVIPGEPASIDLDAFLELFAGKTVYFELEDGSPWGREYYVPGGDETVFLYWNGDCYTGSWAKQGNRYCFYYREGSSCWLTFYEGDEIIVVSEDGMRQRVAQIVENEPLSCEPELLSRLSSPRGAPGL